MTMKTIAVSELKARLSEELRYVRAGGELVVTDRGQPIARLVPIANEADGNLARLVTAGLARHGGELEPAFWSLPRASGGLVAALLAEREEGW
jgi:prevent-host-death family protein